MVLQSTTNVHPNASLLERRTPKIPTPHSNQTTALTASVDITKLRIHSTPNGTPDRQLSSNKPRRSKQSPEISRNIFIICTCILPNNYSRTEHNFSRTIEKLPVNSEKVVQLLNYASTHPESITIYHIRVITVHMYSDTSFLSAPGDKSRSGRYNYLSDSFSYPKKPPHKPPPLNGPIHVEFTTMKNAMEV